jgi:hypothetical protein
LAIFRDYDGQGRDRSAEDRRRHRQLVEESIKKNIGNIIAEESIIGQSKDKIIKVPIRGLKEYGFIYGENRTRSNITMVSLILYPITVRMAATKALFISHCKMENTPITTSTL